MSTASVVIRNGPERVRGYRIRCDARGCRRVFVFDGTRETVWRNAKAAGWTNEHRCGASRQLWEHFCPSHSTKGKP